MSNIISFETAKELKEAGFPQPEPQVGQVWYGSTSVLKHWIILMAEKDGYYLDNRGSWSDVEFFKFCIYGPTVDDILKELPDAKLSFDYLSQLFVCKIYDHRRGNPVGFLKSACKTAVEAVADVYKTYKEW